MKVSIIDWIIKKLKRCLAIVEDGDTASQAINSRKYVLWKGTMCVADNQISSGTTLATSGGSKNLTALTEGGFNNLAEKIVNQKRISKSSAKDIVITIPSNTYHFLVACGGGNRIWSGIVTCGSTGNITVVEVCKGGTTTYTSSTNSLTVTWGSAGATTILDIVFYGNDFVS